MTSLDMPGRSGGSRAARMAAHVGIPGVDLQCVQAFTSQSKHAIIFKGEAQQYVILSCINERVETLLFHLDGRSSARITHTTVYAYRRPATLREVREVQKSPPVAAARWRRDQLTAQAQPHGRAR